MFKVGELVKNKRSGIGWRVVEIIDEETVKCSNGVNRTFKVDKLRPYHKAA